MKNLRVTLNCIFFEVITAAGKCDVKVRLDEADKDGRPHVYVEDYKILGQQLEKLETARELALLHENLESYKTIKQLISEGLRRITAEVSGICDDNGWCLYSC